MNASKIFEFISILRIQEELKLLQFHCSNLEFACGTSLDLVSAMSWDQNELYPQFSGSHCIVMSGYNKMLSALAKGLDVRCNTQVGATRCRFILAYQESIPESNMLHQCLCLLPYLSPHLFRLSGGER